MRTDCYFLSLENISDSVILTLAFGDFSITKTNCSNSAGLTMAAKGRAATAAIEFLALKQFEVVQLS